MEFGDCALGTPVSPHTLGNKLVGSLAQMSAHKIAASSLHHLSPQGEKHHSNTI